jgi:hypothetical protein
VLASTHPSDSTTLADRQHKILHPQAPSRPQVLPLRTACSDFLRDGGGSRRQRSPSSNLLHRKNARIPRRIDAALPHCWPVRPHKVQGKTLQISRFIARAGSHSRALVLARFAPQDWLFSAVEAKVQPVLLKSNLNLCGVVAYDPRRNRQPPRELAPELDPGDRATSNSPPPARRTPGDQKT